MSGLYWWGKPKILIMSGGTEWVGALVVASSFLHTSFDDVKRIQFSPLALGPTELGVPVLNYSLHEGD